MAKIIVHEIEGPGPAPGEGVPIRAIGREGAKLKTGDDASCCCEAVPGDCATSCTCVPAPACVTFTGVVLDSPGNPPCSIPPLAVNVILTGECNWGKVYPLFTPVPGCPLYSIYSVAVACGDVFYGPSSPGGGLPPLVQSWHIVLRIDLQLAIYLPGGVPNTGPCPPTGAYICQGSVLGDFFIGGFATGVFSNPGTAALSTVPCGPDAEGACCLPNGSCVITTQASCALLSGVYQGDGVDCSPNPCPPPGKFYVVPPCGCSFDPQDPNPPSEVWITESQYLAVTGAGNNAFRLDNDVCYDLDAAALDPAPGPLVTPVAAFVACEDCCLSTGCPPTEVVCFQCPSPTLEVSGFSFFITVPGCETIVTLDGTMTTGFCQSTPEGPFWLMNSIPPVGGPPEGCTVNAIIACDIFAGTPFWFVTINVSGDCGGQHWEFHTVWSMPISATPDTGTYQIFNIGTTNTGLIDVGSINVAC